MAQNTKKQALQCSDTAPLIVDFVFRHRPPFHYSRGPPNISLQRRPDGKPFLIHSLGRTKHGGVYKRPEGANNVVESNQRRSPTPLSSAAKTTLYQAALRFTFAQEVTYKTSHGSEKSLSLHDY